MEVSGVSDINSTIQNVNGKTFGKEDFMKILLKQLNYQDPLNPMDSTQFTSQLTQFSSLEQLTNLNTTLENVLAFQQSIQNASITDLIGRTVRVEGDVTNLNNTADMNYELSKDATSVKISIYDKAGRLVVTKEAGAQQQAAISSYGTARMPRAINCRQGIIPLRSRRKTSQALWSML